MSDSPARTELADSDTREAYRLRRCLACGVHFSSNLRLAAHEEQAGHYACRRCGQIFETDDLRLEHKRKAHYANQYLQCFGCNFRTKYAAEYWQHFEASQCPVFTLRDVAKLRDKKLKFAEQLEQRKIQLDRRETYKIEHRPNGIALLPRDEDRELYYYPADFEAAELFSRRGSTIPGFVDLSRPHDKPTISYCGTRIAFTCPHTYCWKQFATREALHRHLDAEAFKEPRRLRCVSCPKAFQCAGSLILHMEASSKCRSRDPHEFSRALSQLTGGILDYDTRKLIFIVNPRAAEEVFAVRADLQWIAPEHENPDMAKPLAVGRIPQLETHGGAAFQAYWNNYWWRAGAVSDADRERVDFGYLMHHYLSPNFLGRVYGAHIRRENYLLTGHDVALPYVNFPPQASAEDDASSDVMKQTFENWVETSKAWKDKKNVFARVEPRGGYMSVNPLYRTNWDDTYSPDDVLAELQAGKSPDEDSSGVSVPLKSIL